MRYIIVCSRKRMSVVIDNTSLVSAENGQSRDRFAYPQCLDGALASVEVAECQYENVKVSCSGERIKLVKGFEAKLSAKFHRQRIGVTLKTSPHRYA